MVKRHDIEADSDLTQLTAQIWQLFDLIRKSGVGISEYGIVLLFLSMYKDNQLTKDFIQGDFEYKEPKVPNSEHKGTNEKHVDYSAILVCFSFTLARLSNNQLNPFFEKLFQIDRTLLRKNFKEIFESALTYSFEANARYTGDYSQPKELTTFMCKYAEKALPENAKVYNPFSGMASFAIFLEKSYPYFGQETNRGLWALGMLRLMAHEKSALINFVSDDSIINWPDSSLKFDLIISSPPFGYRLFDKYKNIDSGIRTADHFLVDKGIQSLSDDGMLIALIPQGFLHRGQKEDELRQRIIENDLLEMIVEFPSGSVLNTNISTLIFVLNKNKKRKGQVLFVKAEKYFEVQKANKKVLAWDALLTDIEIPEEAENIRLVDLDTIRDFDYSFNVARYFQKHFEGTKLGDILTFVRGNRRDLPVEGKHVKISSLSTDLLNSKLNLEEIETTELKSSLLEEINQSCLLISSRTTSLRPTWFDYTGIPIYKSPDILAFDINQEEVDVEYLINELNSEYVIEQLDAYRIGTAMPLISRGDLFEIKLKLGHIVEQRNKVLNQKLHIIRDEEYRINQLRERYDLVREDENSVLRHRIAGRVNNLVGAIESLSDIINEQVINVFPGIVDLKKNSKSNLTLKKHLNILLRDISMINEIISKDYNFKSANDFSDIDFLKFLKNYVSELCSLSKTSELTFIVNSEDEVFDEIMLDESKIKKIIIAGDEPDLKVMLDNLIENAEKHGFKNQPVEMRKINFDCEIDSINMKLIVSISNSGNSLPIDFTIEDFVRNGLTSDVSNGDGYGGYLINKIVTNHKGELSCEKLEKSSKHDDLVTSFFIQLPIKEISYE